MFFASWFIHLLREFIGPLYAVTHSTPIRNSLADLVVDALDSGAGSPSNGVLVFTVGGSPNTEVATLQFGLPAFGAAAAGTATANAITADPDASGGTIAAFEARDSSGQMKFQGSVTATGGGGDITLNSVTISAGQTVSMTSLTYTAPA